MAQLRRKSTARGVTRPVARTVSAPRHSSAAYGPVANELKSIWGWTQRDERLLAELAARLEPHMVEIAQVWAQRIMALADPPLPQDQRLQDAIAWVNYTFLEHHLGNLKQRRLEAVFQENFEQDLALLRSQRDSDPVLRTTLPQLYLSLEVSTAVITEWARVLYAGGAQLPSLLDAYGRIALHMGKTVAQAFHIVRLEEQLEDLRIASSLLETSRALNTRAASVAGVLSNLTHIVCRLMRCDHSLTFLWNESESAYVPAEGLGFSDEELTEIRGFRFQHDQYPMQATRHAARGTRDDGLIARDLMDRFHIATYAFAQLTSSDRQSLGILAAYRRENTPFTDADLQILEGVAYNAGLAIENAMLVEQLKSAAGLKNEFINSMSHEIRTPLHVLFGYLDILSDMHTDDKTRVVLERMNQNTGYLLRLVNTILDVDRIETGRMPVNVETFTADDVLIELTQMFGPLSRPQAVEFTCRLGDGLPTLHTDRLKLLAILNNLVANAFKFTEQGTVTVCATTMLDDHRVRFEVRDSGLGIEPDSIGAVFDLFRQVGPTNRAGTGLGLYIVKRLTDLLGGDVTVESEPGKGSTFRVCIPAVLPALHR